MSEKVTDSPKANHNRMKVHGLDFEKDERRVMFLLLDEYENGNLGKRRAWGGNLGMSMDAIAEKLKFGDRGRVHLIACSLEEQRLLDVEWAAEKRRPEGDDVAIQGCSLTAEGLKTARLWRSEARNVIESIRRWSETSLWGAAAWFFGKLLQVAVAVLALFAFFRSGGCQGPEPPEVDTSAVRETAPRLPENPRETDKSPSVK